MDYSRAHLGRTGEDLAAQYIERHGGRIVARNWRTKRGELDLIVLEKKSLAFVEVKSKSSTAAGEPSEAVDWSKRRKIEQLAQEFIQRRHLVPEEMRFDVVEIVWDDPPAIHWLRGAWWEGE